MPDTLEDSKVDQTLSTATGQEEGTVETQDVQSTAEDNAAANLDSNELPPELEETRKNLKRDYHSKLQALKERELRIERELKEGEEYKRTFGQLSTQEWFKKAYDEERQRRNGQPTQFEMSDEEFQIMRSDDPRAKDLFQKAVLRAAETMVNAKVAPHLNSTKQTVEELKTAKEFDTVASNPKYKDFRELNDKGLLDPYLKKGVSYEQAYKEYKYDHEFEKLQSDFEKKAQDKAQELLEASRNGAISRGGTTSIKGSPIVEASTFDEAFDKVFDLMSKGHKDVKIQRPSKK